jgi:hypothetical protein
MIPARFAPVVFAFFLSMIMSAIISGVSTVFTVGLTVDLPSQWFWAWLPSWAVAFPAVLIVAPIARRIVGRLTKPAE